MNNSRSPENDYVLPASAWALRILTRLLRLYSKETKQDASEIYGVVGLMVFAITMLVTGALSLDFFGTSSMYNGFGVPELSCLVVPVMICLSSTVIAVMLCRDSFAERILALVFLFFVGAVIAVPMLFAIPLLVPDKIFFVSRAAAVSLMLAPSVAVGSAITTVTVLFISKTRPMPLRFREGNTRVSGIVLIMQFTLILALVFLVAQAVRSELLLRLVGAILAGTVASGAFFYLCKRQLNEGRFLMRPSVAELAIHILLALPPCLFGFGIFRGSRLFGITSSILLTAAATLLCSRASVSWLRGCAWSYRS